MLAVVLLFVSFVLLLCILIPALFALGHSLAKKAEKSTTVPGNRHHSTKTMELLYSTTLKHSNINLINLRPDYGSIEELPVPRCENHCFHKHEVIPRAPISGRNRSASSLVKSTRRIFKSYRKNPKNEMIFTFFFIA